MRRSAFVVLLALLAPQGSWAGSYIPQATFSLSPTTLAGMDADAVGNLYLLGKAQGLATYQVTGETTQGITPLFSFDTGLTMPVAFAVEGSGVIDIVDSANGYTLKRYTNPGTFVSSATFFVTYATPNMMATAIDKTNDRVYIAYQYTYHPIYLECLGCGGPSSVTKTTINQYDFQGNLLKTFSMPGTDSTPGSCYTPTAMAADPQGNVYIADGLCQQVVKFSPAGSVTSSTPASQWTYSFGPRGMWTDPASNLYISENVCGPTGCPLGIVKLGSDGSFQTSFTANSTVGCAWDQRILYLSSSGSQPLVRYIYDGAPSVPIESSPLGMVVQHSSAAALSWQTSNDPDGDPLIYTAYLGTNPNQLPAVGSVNQPGFTTQPLTFGVTYYWQVVAQDSYLGLPIQQTPAPVEAFNLNLVNSPPAAFGVVSGTGTAVTRATSATLSWQPAVDPDGDAVVYDVLWGTSAQSLSPLGSTSDTSWPVSGLGFGTTYYWMVRARDVYNAATLMSGGVAQTYYQVFKDLPPAAPAIISGSGTLLEHALTPTATLAWTASTNPQGDRIGYRLYFGTAPAALALAQDSTQTSYGLSALSFGTSYYWQVAAYDPYGGLGATAVQTLLVQLQNTPPQPFAVLTGTGTLSTRATTQLLSWAAAVDPDGDALTYELDLSTSPAAQTPVQTSTATSFMLSFQFGATYYWQVTARDGFGGATSSGLQAFLPLFLNPPPSIPLNQSKTGTIPYHGFSPALSLFWQASTDPSGDPITYSLYYGTDSSHMVAVSSVPLGYTLANLPLNAAIYYQIVAVNSYGAASPSPVNWVFFQFVNNPPGPFDMIGTTGTVSTRENSAALSWTSSVDPDGDPVSYGVLVGTAPSALALLTSTTKNSAVLSGIAFGTTYYWSVQAYDGFGGTTTANEGIQSLRYSFYDPPIPVPAVIQSTGTLPEHALGAQVPLLWSAVQDTEGDSLNYVLAVGLSSSSLTMVQTSTQTSFLISNALFGATYYWQVSAQDPFGGASTTAVQATMPVFLNHPPGAFAVAVGTGTLLTRTTAQVLAWSAAVDPDGDPVTYALSLSTNSGTLAVVQTSSATSFPLTVALGTTYYWTVSAFDGFGGTTPVTGGLQTFTPVFLNLPPQVPNVVSPFSGSPVVKTMRNTVTASWDAVTDPEGDPITYTIYLGNSPGNMQILATLGQAAQNGITSLAFRPSTVRPNSQVQIDSNTITLTLTDLDYYRNYYFQVAAANPYGSTAMTPVANFQLASLDGFPKAYNYPNPFNPNRGGTNIVFNAPPSGYAQATVEIYSEWQALLFKQDYFNIPPGISQVQFNGRDRYGRAFFNGSYVCRVRFSGPDDNQVFFMLVVK